MMIQVMIQFRSNEPQDWPMPSGAACEEGDVLQSRKSCTAKCGTMPWRVIFWGKFWGETCSVGGLRLDTVVGWDDLYGDDSK